MAQVTVKIPDQHYVTFQKRSNDELPLGFMTPEGTDKAAQKRKATADSWAYGYNNDKKIPPQTFDNKLLAGFSFVRSIKRYGGFGSGGNVVWRVADPRGFELEISSANLAEIMRLTTLDKGEIQSRCIWGRVGSDNVLIPEESEQYQEALKNTALTKTSVSAKEVQIGNMVTLQNGLTGVYYGSFFLGSLTFPVRNEETYYERDRNSKKIIELAQTTKTHLFCVEHYSDGSPKRFQAYGSPKFATRSGTDTFTHAEAEKRINAALQRGGSVSATNAYGIDFVFSHKEDLEKFKLGLEQFDINDAANSLTIGTSTQKAVLFEKDGKYYVLDSYAYGRYTNYANRGTHHALINKDVLVNNFTISQEFIKNQNRNGYGYYYSTQYIPERIDETLPTLKSDSSVKWYFVKLDGTTRLGNALSLMFTR